ncbi:tigger transposable element-derived protein 4-like [Diadema antillarum]|uniref:tigger transposable element-derived protein 4-like n=1 Tax=Diadema antillarum TaxID=105358 RepID=UPI003A8377CC
MATRRITSRSYKEKYDIIKFMEANPNAKRKDVAAKFDLKQSSLADIIKKRDKIIKTFENTDEAWKGTRKRVKSGVYDDVAEVLIMWVRQQELFTGASPQGEALLAQAKVFAQEFGHKTWPSPAWVKRFMKRYDISTPSSASTEDESKDDDVIAWNEEVLKDLFKRYKPPDIYCCEETCLYWKLLPGKYCNRKRSPDGNRKDRKHITILMCANMAGTDKVPLYVIGQTLSPSSFRNVQSLPVDYKAYQRGVMTKTFFREWLYKIDSAMGIQDRKIAMVLASCPVHMEEELQNIELVLLPDCLTADFLPMNKGIIHLLKLNYRLILSSRLLVAAESKTHFHWDLLDAVLALRSSWAKISTQAIIEAFGNAGFAATAPAARDAEAPPVDPKFDKKEAQFRDFRILWDKLSNLHPCLPPLEEYVVVDNDGECRQRQSHWGTQPSVNGDSDDGEFEWNTTQDSPTIEEAFRAVNVIRLFNTKTRGQPPDLRKELDSYESFLVGELAKRYHQPLQTDT